MRFTVTGLSGPVTAAKLRIKESPTGSSNSNNCGMTVDMLTVAWNEATVNWTNRPGYAAANLGSVPANSIADNQVVEIALDPASFNADGTYNLALIGTGPGNDTPFVSREGGADGPELILTVGSAKCARCSFQFERQRYLAEPDQSHLDGQFIERNLVHHSAQDRCRRRVCRNCLPGCKRHQFQRYGFGQWRDLCVSDRRHKCRGQ